MINRKILIFLCISALIGLTSIQLFKYVLDTTYTPGRASLSIAESKELNLFVSQPALEFNIIQAPSDQYKIDEAWIEKAVDIDYFLFLFRQVKLRGYRFVIKTSPESTENFMIIAYSKKIICNNHIVLDKISSGGYFYGEFSGELPPLIKCLIKS